MLKRLLLPFVVAFFILACQSGHDQKVKINQGDDHVTLDGEKNITRLFSREQMLSKLSRDRFDVLIIGGGASGAGAALDAASRGLKTALIEAHDFSFGTSSRSTKLVHGGVRYLENAIKHLDWREYELVRDALQERRRFLDNAPHLTNPLPILTPVYGWFQACYYFIGLKIYDLVAGKSSLGASEFLGKEAALNRFPMLKKAGLKGAVLYYDGQFNDARMNLSLILSAIREGAIALNYVKAESMLKEQDRVIGVMVHDMTSNQSWPVYAKTVINATGPYADTVRKLDNPKASHIIELSQGSHVLLAGSFIPPNQGMVIPETKDGRVLFLLPWEGKALVGTTDHPEKISDYPRTSNDEVEYILEHLRNFIDKPIKRSDILATWSGLRPLAKPEHMSATTANISRNHVIEVSPTNLITVVGGKWTTYRKMAEDVVNTAVRVGHLSPRNDSLTKDLKLVGARFFSESLARELEAYEHMDRDIAIHLANSYGDRVDEVININNKAHNFRLFPAYPYLESEVIHAVRNEYALSASDVLARRLRLAFLDNQAARTVLPKVIELMAQELDWDRARMKEELLKANDFLATMF